MHIRIAGGAKEHANGRAMIAARIVACFADRLAASRNRFVAACRENSDIASLTNWMAHEAADALSEVRHYLGATPRVAVWRPAVSMILLGAESGTATAAPAARASDLWIDVVAVPSASKPSAAVEALSAGRARFLRLRDVRRVGTFATLAVATLRDDDDLRTTERMIAELGEPAGRERFGGLAGPWGMVVDVLGWAI